MKRPMTVCGFSMLISLLVASYFSFISQIILMYAIAIGVFVVLGHYKGEQRKTILLTLGVSFLSIFYIALYTTQQYEKVLPLSDQTVEVTGQITDKSITRNGNYAYKVKIQEIPGYTELSGHTAMIYTKTDLQPDYYDVFKGEIYFFEIDSLQYTTNQTKGIMLSGVPSYGSIPDIESTLQKPMLYNIMRTRDHMVEAITQNVRYPENQTLVAMLFGDKSGITDDHYAVFKRAGVAHFLCVSGLHILILSQFLCALLKLFRVPKKVLPYIMILCIIVFVAMTGFSISAVRAGIMSILYYSASIFKREADSLNSLAISALVILLFMPMAVRNVSFQLSFIATFGMIFSSDRLSRLAIEKWNVHADWLKDLIKAFISSVAATIYLIPLLIQYFGEITFFTPVSNILTTPFIIVALSAGILCAIFSLFPALKVLKNISAVVATFCLWVAETVLLWIVQLPFSAVALESTTATLMIIGVLSIVVIAILSQKIRTVIKYGGVVAAIVLVLLLHQKDVLFTEYDDISLNTGNYTQSISV